ncbi:tripartite tricarboxylate transporter substrate binding protein [Verticiella sediminum]|uniref:Tripartite tricarboxylate transporter substrate binding protein n=1 Tax=Verticiella sediminum TaxID=1247510 RepID=A0A556ANL6_9BURK|nr:tripartite tricarboxylate transporter substrate binding protein [Verticiella sediminum]TSH94471.1 tripartite tricarboxylate transporter substrate binding protein [Verticiella sediminum]
MPICKPPTMPSGHQESPLAESATPISRRRRQISLLIGAASVLPAPVLSAEPYPSRPIRMVLPNAPGSSVDTMARQIAHWLTGAVGQSVVVENQPGSGGVIGVQQILRAPKDGYTIGVVANNFNISAYLYKLPYDPVKDVVPVTIATTGPMVLLVNPKVPANSLAEFIAMAKARPDNATVTYGSAGVGTLGHLAGALLESMAGVTMLHVPYKGQNTFTTDLMSGQVEAGFIAPSIALPLINRGDLRAVAVSTATRFPLLPDVPTIAEAGLPGYEIAGSQAVIVAAGTPTHAIDRLNTEVVRVLNSPELTRFVEEQGSQVVGSTVEEAQRWFARDFEVFGQLAQRIGLKPEN